MGRVTILSNISRALPGWDAARALLVAAGHQVSDAGYGPFTHEQMNAGMASDAIIVGTNPITAAHLSQADGSLVLIAKAGVGLDNVDIPAATARGILVANTPGSNAVSVAEHVFALLLALTRGVLTLDQTVRRGAGWQQWPPFVGGELSGKTIGIVGLGSIGSAVATRADAFGMTVLAYDIDCDPARVAAPVACVDLATLLATADVVTLHVPLIESKTRGLIGARELRSMRQGAYVINTSRGGVVDEDALVEALRRGHLAGAGVDVFGAEPVERHALFEFDNVVVTPHVAGVSPQASARAKLQSAQQIVAALDGRVFPGIVNMPALEIRARRHEEV